MDKSMWFLDCDSQVSMFSRLILCRYCCFFCTVGIVDTGGEFAIGINNTRKTGGRIYCRCCWNWWQICRRCKFSKKFETVLLEYSGAGGKLIHEKNQKQKISWHCPYKIGQMLKEFREKRENIIPLKVGKNNKMATGGSPSTQRLLKILPTPSSRPTLLFFCVN